MTSNCRLISCALAAFVWIVFIREAEAAAPQAPRPNVVVFLADDAGWGDYGRSGNKTVAIPNIDSLAHAGVTLDRFFVCPVCAPTRAEFLTGRYHPRGGVRGVSTGQERLDLDERTIAEAFRSAGYATGAFGKWHNGSQWPYHPMARGFDEYFGHTSGHWGEYFNAPLEDAGRMIRTQGYIVDVCTDRALDFIDRNRAKPFFCFVPFTTPHSPWAAPQKDWLRYKDKAVSQQATLAAQENLDETRCALAMLENQDANVGRVLAKLDELKLADDTIVFYFSDNGPNSSRWNGDMKGRKGSTDEGGVRSVGYLRWPAKLPAGRTISEITGAIDLLPTVTSLAGIRRVGDKPLDGRDLTPILLGTATDWPDRMIFSTWAGRVSVRTQQYRLDDQRRLFDMTTDPGQTTPIDQSRPEVFARLTSAVDAWRREMFAGATTSDSTGNKKPKTDAARGQAVDSRPFSVGYREFPITMLEARDGEPHGSVKRSSSAPNCSYFVNWTKTDDSMTWLIDVHTSGRYEATIDYTCREDGVGSTIELAFGERRLEGRVAPAWDPPLNTDQDTLPRPPAESQMKEFRPLKLGVIELEKGRGPLKLRALKIPGKSLMDVRRITLTLLD